LDSIRIPPPVALVDVQAYTYAALCGGAELFEALFENKRYSEFLREQAEELRARFDRFWWQEESTYAFSLAGKEFRPVKRVTPDPGMCLFSGIVPEKLVPKVVSRLFQPDLWTPYGLRSLSNRDPNFRADSYHLGAVWPWQNWLIWLGLRKFGFIKEADAIQEALFKAFLALGSIPEAFAVSCDPPYKIRPIRANPVQAWSSGALLAMLAANKGE
jgi:glycogen debranching enzyme